MIEWIENREQLDRLLARHADYLALLFWGEFSSAAERALAELKQFSEDYKDLPLGVVDVQKLKGFHKEYGVSQVPTVVILKNGKEHSRIEGVESASFYSVRLGGAAPAHIARPTKKKPLSVTVYTSPGCPPCGLAKDYLRKHGISFRAVDISTDERAAQEIVRRSGQRAVPQIDINGRIVVGFDRGKLATLLGIQQERTET